MLTGIRAPIMIVSYVVLVVGGSVALSFAWGKKHLLWGIVVLLTAIVVTVLEGSYLETKRLDQRRSNELAGQRDKHQAEVERLQGEHQGELNRALTAAITSNWANVPDPADWQATADSDGNGMLMLNLRHRRDNLGALLAFGDFRCTLVNPVGVITEISGRSIRSYPRGGCSIQYAPALFPGAPPVRDGTYTFKWLGEDEKGTWHTLAEGRHEVTLDHADESKSPA